MPENVSFQYFQWVVGLLLGGNLALFGWVARELGQLRRDQTADRISSLERAHTQSAHHDNDLRDLWQALNEHRREADMATRRAGDFRERLLEQIGDIKATLSGLVGRAPPPHPPPSTAPGE